MYHARVADDVLPLAVYARALACALANRDQAIEKAIGPLGITMAQLRAADAFYNGQLRESHRRRKGVLAMTFAQAFAEARQEFGLLGEQAAEPMISSAPVRSEAPALPSYLSTPAIAPPVTPSPAVVSGAALVSGGVAVPSAAYPSAGPPVTPAPAALSSTADLPIHVRSIPLPFQAAVGDAPAPVSQPAPAAPSGQPSVKIPAEGGPRVGKLTLAHYAALTIEMSRSPTDLSPILQRYGLSSAEDVRHVTAMFQAQMAVDAELKSRFEALVAHMRSMSAWRDRQGGAS